MILANTNYAILASHRSGSSVLCNLLSQTNVAGKPGEYVSHWYGRSHKDYDITDYPSYLRFVIGDTSTSNSVFGMKTMPPDFITAFERLETFPEYKGLAIPQKIRIFFPNIKVIYLTRRNKILQAVSWWKAVQNNHYHTTKDSRPPETEVHYNFDAITHLLNELVMEECANQELISMLGADTLNVIYEDFVQNMEGTIVQIIDFLEIDEPYQFQPPSLFRTATALNEEWTQRYREELQADWENRRW